MVEQEEEVIAAVVVEIERKNLTSTVSTLDAVFLQYSFPVVMVLLRTFSMLYVFVFPYCSIWIFG